MRARVRRALAILLLILGLVYIVTIRWAPEGVLGALAQWTRRWRRDGVEWQTASPRP